MNPGMVPECRQGGYVAALVLLAFVAPCLDAAPAPAGGGASMTRLEVRMSGPTAAVKVNGTARFRIVITNPGPAAARNVCVTDELPAGITFVGSAGGGNFRGGVVRWKVGTVPAGGMREVMLDVSCALAGTLKNVCNVTADGGVREQARATASFTD